MYCVIASPSSTLDKLREAIQENVVIANNVKQSS